MNDVYTFIINNELFEEIKRYLCVMKGKNNKESIN